MDIYTLWGIRKNCGDEAPELMVAWDEYTVEGNWDGYEAAKAAEVSAWGSELMESREILIRVDHDAILEAFGAPTVSGEVLPQ